MTKHTSAQYKWIKQIEDIRKKLDKSDLNMSHTKKMLNRSLRGSSLGSLIER